MIVYVARNIVNSKLYIGQTKRTLKYRQSAHKSVAKRGKGGPFHAAIRKYGWDAFEWRVAFECNNKDELDDYEIWLIASYPSKMIYNATKGGERGAAVKPENMEEWLRKQKAARKGQKPALGMKHTEENKRKMKEASDAY